MPSRNPSPGLLRPRSLHFRGIGRSSAPNCSPARLAEQAYEQASVFGASFVFMHRVAELGRSGDGLNVSLSDGRRISGRAVVLATGASYRRLGVPSLEASIGAGVFYGGTASEAHGLSGKDAYIVGGGNSAGQAALHLARYVRQVTLVVRAQSLSAGMSHYLVREVEATPNVEVRTGTAVVGGGGEGRLQRQPFSLETSTPGVLAAGDVRRASVKRVASAVGEGSVAIQLVQNLFAYERLHAGRPTGRQFRRGARAPPSLRRGVVVAASATRVEVRVSTRAR